MNIKKSTVDTINIMFIMLSTISPYFIAKFLVFLSLFFLFIRIFLSRDLFLYTNKKILIIIFLLPGIIGVIFIAPENLIRFAGIILIILGFPFSSFKVKSFPILILSYLILLYLIITQILIMQGNQLIIDFREFAYTDESSHLHRGPMYGPVENILDNAFSFEANIRAGGIYSNPNVLALIVLLFFFVLDVSSKNFNETIISNKKKLIRNFSYFLIFLLVTFCFMLAKSRTVIGAFSFYIIFKYIDWSILRRFKIKKKHYCQFFLA